MKVKLIPFLMLVFTAVFIAQLFLLSTPAAVTALPPRPTATAVSVPQTPGAKITLHVAGEITAENWTIVQWQDADEQWQDVTGWQGELEPDGSKTWWLGPELLGQGPFRWQVWADGTLVGQSEAFTLPERPYDILQIVLSLE
ncbi:MAG: hypothetical protein R3D55_14960 [Chloroflexota bacterium]